MSYLSTKRRRDLWQRRWQYGAAALTIFLGVMMFAASYDAYRNLDASYLGTYERLALADMTVTGADESFVADAKALADVAAVETRTQVDIPLRVKGADAFIGRMVGMPADTQPAANKLDMQSGEYLSSRESSDVVVEIHMADHFGLGVGDEVEYFDGLEWHAVTVRGSAVSAEYIWPARSAQEVLSPPDSFGVLFVTEQFAKQLPQALRKEQALVLYDSDADRTALDSSAKALANHAAAASAVTRADQPSNKALSLDLLGFEQMAYAFPALFLLAAGMATYTLMTRLVYREREIIGTLRANGLGREKVVRHYLSYGLWIGVGAAALGIAAGVPLGWYTTFMYTTELGIPDTIRELRWITPVVGLGFGLFTGFISSWVPARAAAALDPAEAMRGEAPTGRGRRSLLETVLPPLRRLPTRWLMVLRGIGRNKRRSLSTVLGVILGLVLIMASWGLIDTVTYLLDKQFNEIQFEDATVVFDGPVTGGDIVAVGQTDGVGLAERVYSAGVSIKGPDGTYETQLMAFEKDTAMHQFNGVELPSGDSAILGITLREQLGVEVGDRVTLAFTGLDAEADVTVADFADEALGTFVYMRDTALETVLVNAGSGVDQARLNQPDVSIVMTRFAQGADREATIGALKDLDHVATASDSRALYLTAQQYMGLFYVLVGMMLVFGGLMSFALIFNTMSVNLAERASELATMRANGLSRRKTAALVVGENLILTFIGIPPGLLAGYWAADALMNSYNSDMFVFPLHFQPLTYLWCSLAMVAVTLISLWPGIRAADRVDIGTIVRQRGI